MLTTCIYAYRECHFRSAPGIVSSLGEILSDSETLYPEKDKKISDNLRIKLDMPCHLFSFFLKGLPLKTGVILYYSWNKRTVTDPCSYSLR
jgi:hypothetical protein